MYRKKAKTNKQQQLKKRKKEKEVFRIIQSFFTCMANTYRLYSNFLKQKKGFTNEKTSTPTGLAWYTKTTAVSLFILLHEKLLQFDWLRAVVFQLNLKYLHVKITNLVRVVV